MVEHATDTNKLKEFLGRKLNESQAKIKKLGRKRKITKSLNIITTVSSMVILSVLASISMLTIPPMVNTILAISSTILTGVSAKFNFQDKTIITKCQAVILTLNLGMIYLPEDILSAF